MEFLFTQLLAPERNELRVDQALINDLIAEIDDQLSAQLDMILHDPSFKQLESIWRSVKLLVDRTDFRENITIEILDLAKDELSADFDHSPEVSTSLLYEVAYTAEFGQFGGEPVGAIISDYDFGPNRKDMSLLASIGKVAMMAHAPFIANAAPAFFRDIDFVRLPATKDITAGQQGPDFVSWNDFRDSEEARFCGAYSTPIPASKTLFSGKCARSYV